MPVDLLQPEGWERPRGYAYGVAARGRWVCVSGMIGEGSDFVSQVRDALRRVVRVLAEADARPEHIVRMTWYVVDKAEYVGASKATGDVYREVIGRHYPAMTAVEVSGLIEPHARVEIEVTAVVPDDV
ncbi:MAG TPA: RidA family protein [Gemmatimonadaceae bacterium]|jgi:enamine deaminase RidA (YjgF/YER057c/UK114 family)|nr:RidA family protein [Gemmatimonadaceae bacterium]